MSIVEIFSGILDKRSNSNQSFFNGYLEDYLYEIEDDHVLKNRFTQIVEKYNDLKIVVDFRFSVNKDVIANQIIRYKDAFKVPKRAWVCPYLVYGKTDKEKDFVVIVNGENKQDYFTSKGIYYCLTEQNAILSDYRNNVLALSANEEHFNLEMIDQVIEDEKSIGFIQRELDQKMFENNADLKAQVQQLSDSIKEGVENNDPSSTSKQATIYHAIVSWFLLKKMLYVQTMVDKELQRELDNDIKKVRHQAKENADSLVFIPLSEMWRK